MCYIALQYDYLRFASSAHQPRQEQNASCPFLIPYFFPTVFLFPLTQQRAIRSHPVPLLNPLPFPHPSTSSLTPFPFPSPSPSPSPSKPSSILNSLFNPLFPFGPRTTSEYCSEVYPCRLSTRSYGCATCFRACLLKEADWYWLCGAGPRVVWKVSGLGWATPDEGEEEEEGREGRREGLDVGVKGGVGWE